MPLSPPRLAAHRRLMLAGADPSLPPWQLVLVSITTNSRSAGKVQTVL